MRIKFVFNNCKRPETVVREVNELKKWCIKLNPHVDIEYTNINNIPFVAHLKDSKGEDLSGIDHDWYDRNITPKGVGYDIILFAVDEKNWKTPNRARGWRTDADFGPVELHVCYNEDEKIWGYPQYKTVKDRSMFFLEASHELSHAFYMITGQPDLTHFLFDAGILDAIFHDLKFPKNYSLPAIMRALAYITRAIEKLMIKEKTPSEKILERSNSFLGLDASPNNLVDKDVACAESYTTLMKGLFPEIPIITGTWTLNDYLSKNAHFQAVTIPHEGDTIISVTGTGNGKIQGHVGIIARDSVIHSNNSNNGLWEGHFTLKSWIDYYVVHGQLKTYYYRRIVV
jgi:hypothetical protein